MSGGAQKNPGQQFNAYQSYAPGLPPQQEAPAVRNFAVGVPNQPSGGKGSAQAGAPGGAQAGAQPGMLDGAMQAVQQAFGRIPVGQPAPVAGAPAEGRAYPAIPEYNDMIARDRENYMRNGGLINGGVQPAPGAMPIPNAGQAGGMRARLNAMREQRGITPTVTGQLQAPGLGDDYGSYVTNYNNWVGGLTPGQRIQLGAQGGGGFFNPLSQDMWMQARGQQEAVSAGNDPWEEAWRRKQAMTGSLAGGAPLSTILSQGSSPAPLRPTY